MEVFFWNVVAMVITVIVIHEPGHWAAARLANVPTGGLALIGRGVGWKIKEPETVHGGILVYSGGTVANLLVGSAILFIAQVTDMKAHPAALLLLRVGMYSVGFALLQVVIGGVAWLVWPERADIDIARVLDFVTEARRLSGDGAENAGDAER